jgi:mycothiol system anti-sigma-R factor
VNCREAFAKLYEYLDKELCEDDKKHLDQHHEICSDCLKKYELEEEFNKVIKQKICSKPDVTHLKNRIREQIDKIDASSQPRNFLFLLMPLSQAYYHVGHICSFGRAQTSGRTALCAHRDERQCLQYIANTMQIDSGRSQAGLTRGPDLPEGKFAAFVDAYSPAAVGICVRRQRSLRF